MRLCRALCWGGLVRRVGVLLVVMLLLVVVVVDYSRPGMVRRMVVGRRQTLGWMRVMLRAAMSVCRGRAAVMVFSDGCRDARD